MLRSLSTRAGFHRHVWAHTRARRGAGGAELSRAHALSLCAPSDTGTVSTGYTCSTSSRGFSSKASPPESVSGFVLVDTDDNGGNDASASQNDSSSTPTDFDSSVEMTPSETVTALDRFIIGQHEAKKSLAVALRNRWRRRHLSTDLQNEVYPMNILMIGPTGTGKTELSRRLAKLIDAPFVKVEATKYTEVGFYGTDTDECVRDLVNASFRKEMEKAREKVRPEARSAAEETIIAAFSRGSRSTSHETLRQQIRSGALDDIEISIQLPRVQQESNRGAGAGPRVLGSISSKLPAQLKELQKYMKHLDLDGPDRDERQKVKIGTARERLQAHEESKRIDEDSIAKLAIKSAEQSGIIFLDEIDKVAGTNTAMGSRFNSKGEGVQKELLALVEGCTVTTDYGPVNTDHILFVGSGAFHRSKPSDLLPELQGRLPIKVTLDPLKAGEFKRILTETENNLIDQQVALLGIENVTLTFKDDAIERIASYSAELNATHEDIGARRLRTVIAKVIEDISFDAPKFAGEERVIDGAYVKEKLGAMLEKSDLSKYIM